MSGGTRPLPFRATATNPLLDCAQHAKRSTTCCTPPRNMLHFKPLPRQRMVSFWRFDEAAAAKFDQDSCSLSCCSVSSRRCNVGRGANFGGHPVGILYFCRYQKNWQSKQPLRKDSKTATSLGTPWQAYARRRKAFVLRALLRKCRVSRDHTWQRLRQALLRLASGHVPPHPPKPNKPCRRPRHAPPLCSRPGIEASALPRQPLLPQALLPTW